MIIGIDLKEHKPDEDTYRVVRIGTLEEVKIYDINKIKEFMKEYQYCVIVPERSSLPFIVSHIDTYNTIYNLMNIFEVYSKANHREESYQNFIFKAGYLHGRSSIISEIKKDLNNDIWLKT